MVCSLYTLRMHRHNQLRGRVVVYSCTQTRQARTYNTTAAAARYRDVDMMNLYVKSAVSIGSSTITPVQLAHLYLFVCCVALHCSFGGMQPSNGGLLLSPLLSSLVDLPAYQSCSTPPSPSSLIFFHLLLRERFYVLCTMSAKFPMGIGLECGRLHLSLGPPCAG